MSSTDVDPRFDPRYQRGFDAERHRPVAQTVAPDVVAAVPVVAASPIPDEATPDDPEFEEFADEPIRRRNPYLVALAALPLVLLGAGTYLMVWYAGQIWEMYDGNGFGYDYTVATIVPMIAPALIVTGFASLIVVLTQLALGRGRRG